MKQTMNFYLALSEPYNGMQTAMYSGFAPSEERFVELCQQAGFDLDGLEIELHTRNPKDELGRPFKEGVGKDLGTI